MKTLSSTISNKEPILKRVKSKNKRLVNILNHKMFKGYREIKKSKECILRKPKYIEKAFWENKELYPFDDDYNLEYKRKNLSCFFKKDLSDMIQVNNYSQKNDIKEENNLKNKIKKKLENHKNRNNFRMKSNISLYLKKRPDNDKYFYFSSNSLLIRNDLYKNNNQKKNHLFKTIFAGENEKGLYNDIPIFAIEKIHKIKNNKNKKFIYLPSKEERMVDLQFLYKVSHRLPLKKTDFRIKYNIKSAKSQKKKDLLESAIITTIPQKIQSAKPNINRLSLKSNKSDIFMTNINNNNNKNRVKSARIKRSISKGNLDIINFHNYILKRAQSSSAYKSRNRKLVKNYSDDILVNIDQNILCNKDRIEKKEGLSYFPYQNRFVNDQIVLNYINYKKRQFENLKNIIEC